MMEINFVELIQNSLSVAGMHRDRLFRSRLSIVSPLSNGMVRKTRTPRFGIAASTTPRPRVVVPARVIKTGANSLSAELELLQEFQMLHHFFLVSRLVPSTQIPKLMRVLSRFPVISVTTLALDAQVSRDTAKRWLHGLERSGKLQVREFNGMKQYGYSAVIEILDRFVRYSAVP